MYRAGRPTSAWRESPRSSVLRPDLLSLTDRLRYLRVLRVGLALLAAVAAVAVAPREPSVSVASAGYLAGALLLERGWQASGRALRAAVPALLLADAAALAWAVDAVGGSAAGWPLRCLVLVHVAGAALLAAPLTLAAVVGAHAVLQLAVGVRAGGDAAALTAWAVAVVAVALTVVWLSAVNTRELRRRRLELEGLALMGRRLEEAHDPVAVGNVLLDSVCTTFGFRRVVLFDVADDSLRMLTCGGIDDAVVRDFSATDGSVLTAATHTRRGAVVARLDGAADPWLDGVLPRARDVVVMPLVADEVVGVLVADSGGRQPVDRRLTSMLERFTAHAAFALRNAVLLERVQQMAVTDALTRLANRRSFDRALARDLARAQRSEGRVSVVLLDVDEFKRLNDTHGHVVGDEVLQQVAAVLQECGREYDTVARYGGEEFGVVLPGCSTSLAARVAERLRSQVELADTQVPVTVSAGVATYPVHGDDAQSLLESADFALYAAKRAGRNRVVTVEQARSSRKPAAG